MILLRATLNLGDLVGQLSPCPANPLALIVIKEETEPPHPKEMVAHVKSFIDKGLMSKLALLLEVSYVDQIAKTSVGKIDKKVLRKTFL